jgi:hypothetical protein
VVRLRWTDRDLITLPADWRRRPIGPAPPRPGGRFRAAPRGAPGAAARRRSRSLPARRCTEQIDPIVLRFTVEEAKEIAAWLLTGCSRAGITEGRLRSRRKSLQTGDDLRASLPVVSTCAVAGGHQGEDRRGAARLSTSNRLHLPYRRVLRGWGLR